MKLLQIHSSAAEGESVSRQLVETITTAIAEAVPGLEIVTRDLAAHELPHLSAERMPVVRAGKTEDLTPVQQDELALAEAVLDEFLSADVVVVGAPMYNFSVPSQLKAWIDRLARAGRTFRYGPNGAEGLAGGRKVIVVSSRGGVYSSNPAMAAFEHQESWLKAVFSFIGITDVEIVRAEGIGMGPEARAKAIAAAEAEIARLVPQAVAA
ncbi:MAG: FMN-dependent NADH-azoreductase [Tistrella sp.]|uniref:FMN dependent NADH:quinone oxidoreductase n=1 Tax=Tistrella mobilis TaxID=171437 RepID=A0A3B9IMI9_9PROT|nr:FMN-dependent NADH-azoreductase [Tistrella sp.]MAD35726.1 FMN-dependent NADH-azoreductase [Tistrella sp.]MBA79414.1 FMN-dependent NADH-azoreductase [Tistrella sp.]HAE49082.1 FMN-dependent NADH-azoreductase [Tistrella mobilis]